MKNLPPLNALRAFVIVARSGTIAAASKEMGISSSAISQQIRNLENWLGLSLFNRKTRDLILTDRGREYFQEVSHAINAIATATSHIVGTDISSGLIRVSVLPSFSSLWLLPKLADFTEQHPDIEIDLISSTSLCSFKKDDIDFAIRYGMGDYLGLEVDKLLPEAVAPACHPKLIQDILGKDIHEITLHDLTRLPIIDDGGSLKGIKHNMQKWLEEQGVRDPQFKEHMHFSDSHIACEAARLGKGLILGRVSLIADWLETGDLIIPINKWEIEKTAYYIVYTAQRPMRPQVKLFYHWLKDTAQEWMNDPRRQKIFYS
ncbi:MAG: LysR substrate-binding domain-containing protein [Terasakiella sp.]|uniref:LysR substrate-binding domain-containing protein n=1 Tax=unclassified Terasakiella TaxID=2614952 RepID=UPI003B00C98D